MPLKIRPYILGGYSVHHYVFTPKALLGAVITVGDEQDVHFSGPGTEIVTAIISYCGTAPLTTAATWQLEYASTVSSGTEYRDIDLVTVWTEIESFSHTASNKAVIATSGFTNATIPAARAIRFNVDAVGGTAAQDVKVVLEVWRPIQA